MSGHGKIPSIFMKTITLCMTWTSDSRTIVLCIRSLHDTRICVRVPPLLLERVNFGERELSAPNHTPTKSKKGRPKATLSLAEKTRRESAIIRLRQGGVSAEVIAKAFGISDRTLRRWNAEFSAEN